MSVLTSISARLERASLFAKTVRSTGILSPVGPIKLARFARAARHTTLGPHLPVMFHAAAHPEKEAIVEYDHSGMRRLTWGQFDGAINRLAHALAARGAVAGTRVALMLPNCTEILIAQQALARLGATAVQIGYRLKPAEVAYILDHADPAVAILHAEYLPTMRAARELAKGKGGAMIVVGGGRSAEADADGRGSPAVGRAAEGQRGGIDGWDAALAAGSPDAPPSVIRGGDGGGVIIYTSGTTGKPKGANRKWKQTGFDSVADMMLQVGVRADDRHLVVCPLYHSAAPAFVAIMQALGATIVLMNHFDPAGALALIASEKITSAFMVPTMLVRITNLPPEELARHDTSSLRWIMSGAAPLATETARRVMQHFGPVLWNFYGATETGLVTLAGPSEHTARPGTIGKLLHGNEVRLLADDGHDVAQGEIGELYARNATMIAGYHANAEATKSAQRDGFFSVGDMGRVDGDGYYYLEARKHDMVISGGVNIYPREIEDHLHTHPAILEAAVIGVPDAEWGESLRAFVVLRAGATVTADEVIDYCRRELADYKRPRQVTFVAELPRNPTGKVLKRELRELA